MQIIRHRRLNKAGGIPCLPHGLMATISGLKFLCVATGTLGRNMYVCEQGQGSGFFVCKQKSIKRGQQLAGET